MELVVGLSEAFQRSIPSETGSILKFVETEQSVKGSEDE